MSSNKWTFSSLQTLSEVELKQRSNGIAFINYLSDRFGLPSGVSGRASVLFHRFFTINKLQQDVSAACLLVATKISDVMISISALAERLGKATTSTNSSSKGMPELKTDWLESLYFYEELLLAELCFDLDLPDAFEDLIALQLKLDITDENIKSLSWTVLHDSFNTDICVRFHSEDIAAGALLYVLESKSIRPDNSFWKAVYSQDLVRDVKSRISEMYTSFMNTS